MKARIGMVTIGQSPRVDVVPEMAELLGPGGTTGQRLSFGLTGPSVPGGWLSVFNPDGTTLAAQYFWTDNTALDLPVLGATGTYSVLIDRADPHPDSGGSAALPAL
jgi:hypothetical protein